MEAGASEGWRPRSSTDSGTAGGPKASSLMPRPNSLGRRMLPERSLPTAVDGPPRAGCPVLVGGGAAVQVLAPGDPRGDPHKAVTRAACQNEPTARRNARWRQYVAASALRRPVALSSLNFTRADLALDTRGPDKPLAALA